MWKVLIEKKAQKELDEAPDDVKVAYAVWLDVAKNGGAFGLLQVKSFRDHALTGPWKGARSSYLNYSWRVIYTSEKNTLTILIVRITNHDYRQKK